NDAPVSVPFAVTDNCACNGWSVTASGGTVSFDSASKTGSVTFPPGNVNGTATATLSVTDCSGNSSQAVVTAREQTCFCTYTQGGWGATCNGGNIACTRDAHFADVYTHPAANPAFPSGTGATYVALGNQTTRDLIFNSAKAVDNYLPNGTTPGTVSGNPL